MPFAVEMWLDPNAEKQVRTLWEGLATADVFENPNPRDYQPHVTLSVCENLDVDAFARDFKTFGERTWFPELQLSHLGLFLPPEGAVAFLGVVKTERLAGVHKEFHGLFNDHSESIWEYYRPSDWVPHCTLAEGLSVGTVPRTMATLARARLPFTAQVHALTLVELPSGRIVQQVRQ